MIPSGIEREMLQLRSEVTQLRVDKASMTALHESLRQQYQRDIERLECDIKDHHEETEQRIDKLQIAYDELRDKKNKALGWIGAATFLWPAILFLLKHLGWDK